MTGIELARAVKDGYDSAWILPNVRRALQEAVRFGTLHIQAFADVDTTGTTRGSPRRRLRPARNSRTS